jgi:hypothetical protein
VNNGNVKLTNNCMSVCENIHTFHFKYLIKLCLHLLKYRIHIIIKQNNHKRILVDSDTLKINYSKLSLNNRPSQ